MDQGQNLMVPHILSREYFNHACKYLDSCQTNSDESLNPRSSAPACGLRVINYLQK